MKNYSTLIYLTLIFSTILFILGLITELFGRGAIDNSPIKILYGAFLLIGPGFIYSVLVLICLKSKQAATIYKVLFVIISFIMYTSSSFFISLNSNEKNLNLLLSTISSFIFLLEVKFLLKEKISILFLLLSLLTGYLSFLPEIGREFFIS